MDKLDDNITFFLDDNNDTDNNDTDNNDEITKMMDEFNNLSDPETQMDNQYFNLWDYEDEKYNNLNDDFLNEKEYTIKDLLKICSYYGIDKNVKMSKCKKQDIIATLIFFESLPENFLIVQKRNRMWQYMNELSNDPKMKRFIIWN
jgi:hypothetical protein